MPYFFEKSLFVNAFFIFEIGVCIRLVQNCKIFDIFMHRKLFFFIFEIGVCVCVCVRLVQNCKIFDTFMHRNEEHAAH